MRANIFISIVCFAFSIDGAQLNNNYLPPANAQSAGGQALQPPKAPGQGFAGANAPIAPGINSPRPVAPSRPGSAPLAPPRPGAAPSQPSGPPIEIISYENVNNGDGSFKWSYESANGIKAEESGDVKNKGSDNAIQTVQGSYSYTSPEGDLIQITYTADENGFQAQGDSLPTPVPLPEENLRALAEFEAAYATAVPEAASAVQGSNSQPGARPASSPGAPSARPGSPPAPRPGAPSAPRPGSPSPAAAGGFASQQRPGGGAGNYDSKSGYSY